MALKTAGFFFSSLGERGGKLSFYTKGRTIVLQGLVLIYLLAALCHKLHFHTCRSANVWS